MDASISDETLADESQSVQEAPVQETPAEDTTPVEEVPEVTDDSISSTPVTEEPITDQQTETSEEYRGIPVEEDAESTAQYYVLNTNTMKFHYPHCKSVSTIREYNWEDVTATREELISQGYSPCQNCNP